MKKINFNSVLVYSFIATALISLSVILIALSIILFGPKSTSEWQFTKAASAHFEVKGHALDFCEAEIEATSFQKTVAEKFAAVDTFVYKNGAYLLIKNDKPNAGYTDLSLQAEQVDVKKLTAPFKKVPSDITNGELWVRMK